MGTNYYAITDACDHCGRHNRLHICKSLTSFEGHFLDDYDDGTGQYKIVPWLTSWAEWKDYLRASVVVRIDDEYGTTHTVEDFITRVEATDREARRRQHDWMVKNEPARIGRVARSYDWLDADGFSFYGGGFS